MLEDFQVSDGCDRFLEILDQAGPEGVTFGIVLSRSAMPHELLLEVLKVLRRTGLIKRVRMGGGRRRWIRSSVELRS